MVYKRTRRKRRYRKKAPGRGAVYGAAAGQLVKDVKMLKGLINVEFKYLDTVGNAKSMTTSGNIDQLLLVAQGDGGSSRDGNQIRAKSLELNFNVTQHSSATASQARVIVGIQTDPEGNPPAWTDLMISATTVAPRNLQNRHNFIILKDYVFPLAINGRRNAASQFYRRIDLKQLYNGTGASIGSLKQGGLFIAYLANEATNTPTLNYYSRVRYLDN